MTTLAQALLPSMMDSAPSFELTDFTCPTLAERAPSFEGIDPPLLDPLMVEHFNNLPQPAADDVTDATLQSLSLEDLIKIAAQLCETDPSFSYQILSALGTEPGPGGDHPMESEGPGQPLPDILDSLSQSLLQEYAAQLAQAGSGLGKVSSGQAPTTTPSPPASISTIILRPESTLLHPESTLLRPESTLLRPESTLLRPESTLLRPESTLLRPESTLQDAMKANLFILEKQATNFVPLLEYHKNKPRPKYTRKNFSPDQIDGLEAAFQEHRFVKKDLRRELAKKLNLSERSISYWFQNKRARSKPPITMSSEAALKAAGTGKPAELSPEQGLPITAESLASVIQDMQQNLQQSCAT